MKRPAYTRALTERVAAGHPVALVVVSLHDWRHGRLLEDRPGVVRMVVPPDVPAGEVDLSLLFGHDVLVLGGDDVAFYTLALMALMVRAQSVWGEFADGLARCETLPSGRLVTTRTVEDADALLELLPAMRMCAAVAGAGAFADPVFRPARAAAIGQVFGQAFAERWQARSA